MGMPTRTGSQTTNACASSRVLSEVTAKYAAFALGFANCAAIMARRSARRPRERACAYDRCETSKINRP
jgi:hypothetical protein